jgi:hypothetical protein
MVIKRRLLLVLLALVGFCTPAAAQQPLTAPPPARDTSTYVQDADVVRDQLQDILRGHPRSVGEVLRRDPSLLARIGAALLVLTPLALCFVLSDD